MSGGVDSRVLASIRQPGPVPPRCRPPGRKLFSAYETSQKSGSWGRATARLQLLYSQRWDSLVGQE